MFTVILVKPKYQGNIGAVARAIANFGLERLGLVRPPELGGEAYSRAMHGREVLAHAKIFTSFEEATQGLDYVAGTSSIASVKERKHLRTTLSPSEFAERVKEVEGEVGIVFGREDYGLLNEELCRCDVVVKIPTSDSYPTLNLSHACSIILYELFRTKYAKERRKISGVEKEKLVQRFAEFLDSINYPKHKKKPTALMIKRILGRAMLSPTEFHTLMGILKKPR